VSAEKAQHAKCGARMKRKLINVDLSVCKRHHEKVQHVKSKRNPNEDVKHSVLYTLILISEKIYRKRYRRDDKEDVKEMPKAKASKNISVTFILENIMH
jgi:hypothetical protein